jgi:hypothetical protein
LTRIRVYQGGPNAENGQAVLNPGEQSTSIR